MLLVDCDLARQGQPAVKGQMRDGGEDHLPAVLAEAHTALRRGPEVLTAQLCDLELQPLDLELQDEPGRLGLCRFEAGDLQSRLSPTELRHPRLCRQTRGS